MLSSWWGEEVTARAQHGMGRHTTGPQWWKEPSREWASNMRMEWAEVVGGRIRRLRTARGWTLVDLARATGHVGRERPAYSGSYYSRLERGWASAPLHVYLMIARALEVKPGDLLGPEEVEKGVTAEERVLLDAIRALGLSPGGAIAALADPGRPADPGGPRI